jgi:RNA polymerase sigma-70 factor (ECF subfamily)
MFTSLGFPDVDWPPRSGNPLVREKIGMMQPDRSMPEISHRSPGDHLTSLHIQKAIRNDRESVTWLISRFTPLLLCQARQRIGPSLRRHCDPDDVVADVWMTVLSALRELTPSGGSFTQGLLGFASTVLIRRLRDLLEKHVIDKPVTMLLGTPDAQETALQDPTRDVVAHLISEEYKGRVWESLDRLLPSDREIIVLRGIEGRPHKEVGELVGLSAASASVRYHRALKRLREEIPASIFDDLAD